LDRFDELTILHITDGAPADMHDAAAHGFALREDYASARRKELVNALAFCGARASTEMLEVVDQTASFHLVELAKTIAGRIESLRPELVLTHPYEGGHPDHDACAFAVHAGAQLAGFSELGEFASYHAGPPGVVAGQFLAGPEAVFVAQLSAEERARKQLMLDCFETQRATLAGFPTDAERYRRAPAYDFGQAPHPGRLFYEHFEWGMKGGLFRALAQQAFEELGLQNPL
jgi:LmbE family N-acetylglucosaminyl deacetylase